MTADKKPITLALDAKWCTRMAELEGDAEIGAGALTADTPARVSDDTGRALADAVPPEAPIIPYRVHDDVVPNGEEFTVHYRWAHEDAETLVTSGMFPASGVHPEAVI